MQRAAGVVAAGRGASGVSKLSGNQRVSLRCLMVSSAGERLLRRWLVKAAHFYLLLRPLSLLERCVSALCKLEIATKQKLRDRGGPGLPGILLRGERLTGDGTAVVTVTTAPFVE